METDQFLWLQNQIQSMTWVIGSLSLIGAVFTVFLTTRMKELASIDQKLESLDKLKTIESNITDAVKKIEHDYWNQQQIKQLGRDRIEQLYIEVQNDIRFLNQSYVELSQGRPALNLMNNNAINMIINLYFLEELGDAYQQYNKSFMLYQTNHTDATWIRTKDGQIPDNLFINLSNSRDEFSADSAIFTGKIIALSNGVTRKLKAEEST